jgi:hypothetical protein
MNEGCEMHDYDKEQRAVAWKKSAKIREEEMYH